MSGHDVTGAGALRRDVFKGAAAVALVAATTRRASAQAPRVMRIGINRGLIFIPSVLMQSLLGSGWKVELANFVSPADLANAIVAGSVDFGFTGATIAAVARSKGAPIVIVANSSGKGTALIVGAKTDIHTLADLRHKRIGQIIGGIQDVQLREQLRLVGMTLRDVVPIPIAFADLPSALQSGGIDAFCGGEPASTQTIHNGYGRLLKYPYDTPIGDINSAILTREDIAHGNPAMMKAFVAAYRKAVETLRGDLDQAAQLAAKDWGFDQGICRTALDNVDMRWAIDDTFMSNLRSYNEQRRDVGVIATVPDIDKLVVRDYAQA